MPVDYTTKSLWKYHDYGYWAVIPHPVAWTMSNEAVLGVEPGRTAAERYPAILKKVAYACRRKRNDCDPVVLKYARIITLPTQPLNPRRPWLGWKNPNLPRMIVRSLLKLTALIDRNPTTMTDVVMPLIGHPDLSPAKAAAIINRTFRGKIPTGVTVLVADSHI